MRRYIFQLRGNYTSVIYSIIQHICQSFTGKNWFCAWVCHNLEASDRGSESRPTYDHFLPHVTFSELSEIVMSSKFLMLFTWMRMKRLCWVKEYRLLLSPLHTFYRHDWLENKRNVIIIIINLTIPVNVGIWCQQFEKEI